MPELRMEPSGIVRRKDTTKGPPLRILTLDGGGVRGYSMLILLQELMHRTFVEIEGRAPRRHEIPKPCDHFDLIAGTGTGGLIAIMLGRLRMDLETCKDVYVRMTKRVFETDKTIAGIPYRSTLFKASKLEDAIRECVRDHTIDDNEGNDVDYGNINSPSTPMTAGSRISVALPQRSPSTASRYSQIGASPIDWRNNMSGFRPGNPNAMMYDTRENRTKTAVTAVLKNTKGTTVLLRSYDSRKEPELEKNCTIWQAARATAAVGLAFKSIQVGQFVFLDEGEGKYNPSPKIMDEAVCNEWPGREVGVFLSIGTGKRPSGTNHQQHLWWEGFVTSNIGDFAEARRRLISKIEGCEDTHQYMLKEHLAKRKVNPENYYRLNVEVGVGELGMNEWNRLADISTNTRTYLSRNEVQGMNFDAAAKLARIHRAKIRWERQEQAGHYIERHSWEKPLPSWERPLPEIPPTDPMVVELPAEPVVAPLRPHHRQQRSDPTSMQQYQRHPSAGQKFTVISSDEYPQPVESVISPPRSSAEHQYPYSPNDLLQSPASGTSSPRRSGEDPRRSGEYNTQNPPPRPPKTPLNQNRPPVPRVDLPYPETDGPPPVNMARKPEFGAR